jgi:hypothetical protein
MTLILGPGRRALLPGPDTDAIERLHVPPTDTDLSVATRELPHEEVRFAARLFDPKHVAPTRGACVTDLGGREGCRKVTGLETMVIRRERHR